MSVLRHRKDASKEGDETIVNHFHGVSSTSEAHRDLCGQTARSRATLAPILSMTAVTCFICLSENIVKAVRMGVPCKLLSAVLAVTMLWKY